MVISFTCFQISYDFCGYTNASKHFFLPVFTNIIGPVHLQYTGELALKQSVLQRWNHYKPRRLYFGARNTGNMSVLE
jgi:hypothetical protein